MDLAIGVAVGSSMVLSPLNAHVANRSYGRAVHCPSWMDDQSTYDAVFQQF